AVAFSLENKNRHDGKSVVGLDEQVLRDQQSLRTLQERVWVFNRRAEIARYALPVLNGKGMVAAVPFQALVAQPESVAVRGRNYRAARGGTALGVRKIKPNRVKPKRPFEIIESDIDIVLCVVSILRNDVGPRSCEIRNGHLADAKVPILDTGAVAAHVQGIEVVNLDMLASVVAFTSPEFRVWLTLQDVAAAHKGFPQTKLVISRVPRKICVARVVSSVRLDHHFRLQPRFVVAVIRVQPVVDEDEFSVGFCFVAQAIFRIRAGGLKRDLRSALAVKAISRTEIAV